MTTSTIGPYGTHSGLGGRQQKRDAQPAGRRARSPGYALDLVQNDEFTPRAKPLYGFGSDGVYELRDNYAGDTFRAVYALKLGSAIYVLHCFQKKSHTGSKMPRANSNIVLARLKQAKTLAAGMKTPDG